MFKDAYIRDNNRIKPDETFLKQLKETVAQEEDKVFYIGDYKDADKVKEQSKSSKVSKRWIRNAISIAACFVLVCGAVFYMSKLDPSEDSAGLKTNIQDAFEILKTDMSGTTETADVNVQISEECQQQYDTVYEMFQNETVRIYQVKSFENKESGLQYLQKILEDASELEREERDELVSDILAEQYILAESNEEFDSEKCYIAEFENDSVVCFAIGEDKYIYIEEISGMQSLASVE